MPRNQTSQPQKRHLWVGREVRNRQIPDHRQPEESGTTFEPFLACSRLDLTCNSTGIGFTAPDGISCSPTRAADGGPNSNLPRIRSRLSHHHLQARPPKTLLAYLLAVLMSNAMGIGHAAFRRFALLPHAPTKIPPSRAAGHQQKPTNQLNDSN